jgi:hypothetical protein
MLGGLQAAVPAGHDLQWQRAEMWRRHVQRERGLPDLPGGLRDVYRHVWRLQL